MALFNERSVKVAFFGKPDAAAFWAAQAAETIGATLLPEQRDRARAAAAEDRVGYSNLWAAALRIVAAREVGGAMVSASCAIDEVGVQGVGYARLKQEMEHLNSLVPALEGPNGQPILTPEVAKRTVEVNSSSSIMTVLFQQAVEEAATFWDYMYFCRFAGDEEVDGLGSGSGEVVDAQIDYALKATRVPAFSKVVDLPADESAALAIFEAERERW